MRRFFKIGLFFLLLNIGSWGHAQNLVSNPSFDQVDTCNPTANWVWNLSSWENLGYYDGIAYGTPDAYNACNFPSQPPVWSFPYTWLSFQYPRTGDGFIGAFYGALFNRLDLFQEEINHGREYFASQLIEPMQSQVIYCVGGYINNRNLNYIPPALTNFWTVRTDRISIGFHNSMPELNSTWLFTGINHIATLTQEDSSVVYDTLGWAHMRTPYFAQGNESHIVMGNLFSDTASGFTLYTNMNQDSIYSLPVSEVPTSYFRSGSYFYLDDIYVIPIHQPHIEVQVLENGYVWLIDTTNQEERSWYKTGDDLVLGNGDSLYLQVSNGSSYTLHSRNCRVEMSDTVVIDLSGLEKIDKTTIHLFPNPSNNSITLQSPLIKSGANLFLRDLSGRLIRQLKFQELNNYELSTQDLADGIYLVQIIGEDGRQVREKFVVQH